MRCPRFVFPFLVLCYTTPVADKFCVDIFNFIYIMIPIIERRLYDSFTHYRCGFILLGYCSRS